MQQSKTVHPQLHLKPTGRLPTHMSAISNAEGLEHKQSMNLNPCISVPELSSYVCRQGMAQRSYQAVYFNCKQYMSPLGPRHLAGSMVTSIGTAH